jgi:Fe-S oxidoreductase
MLKKLFQKLTSLGGNTLYYPGCLTKFAAPEIEENYRNLLEGIGIDFITIPEFACCGSPVLNAGYKEDFDNLMQKNREIFERYNVKRIITNCPSCYRMFRENFNMPVEHVSQVLYRNLSKVDKRWNGEKACYHDPCHLGRHSDVYREPRKVLEAAGLRLVEMSTSKDKATCCGGGAGLRNNYPGMSAKIAKIRVSQCREKILITTCTLCWKQLKEAAPEGMKVLEFSEALLYDEPDN